MSDGSTIEWTQATWNPVTGCTKVSPGCAHCLAPDTRILMSDMSWRPLRDVEVGDRVVSFTENPVVGQNRTYSIGTVEAKWETVKPAVEITAGGHSIVASEDHPFLTYTRPQWKTSGSLQLSSGIIGIGAAPQVPDVESNEYLAGYASGAIEGDGTFRWQPGQKSDKLGFPQAYCRVAVLEEDRHILDRIARAYALHGIAFPAIRRFDGGHKTTRQMIALETRALASLEAIHGSILQHRDSLQYKMGWLAGFFDSDGCYSGKNLRFSQKEVTPLLVARRYAAELGFELKIEDAREGTFHTAILIGTLEHRIRFLCTIRPALERKCADFIGRRFPRKWERVDGVVRLGPRNLIDIQVDTRTFIAEGFATHNCYAETFAERFRGVAGHPYENGFDLQLRPERLELPLTWTRPRRIFVNSMSDLFHADVPTEFIQQTFETMRRAHWHEFQVLTKRPERTAELANDLPWPDNVWMGTSVENQRWTCRIDELRKVPAKVRFLSCEPLLGPLNLDLSGIHWVIVGGESGPRSRPMKPAWAESIKQQCAEAGVPFFFKQWGAYNCDGKRVGKGRAGRELHGQTWDGMPTWAPP
jgi:protein gp37